MSYNRHRKIRRKETGTFSLNITSMTDMFTMLLCFLLQTYATSDVQIDLENGVRLPVSSSLKNPSRAPQVTITTKEIKVDGKVIVKLTDGQLTQADLDPQNPQVIKALLEELRAKLAPDGNSDAVLLQADSSNNMAALSRYFTTISAAGFPKVKLATLVGR